ncbi:MAG: hypothetical protein Q4B18_02640 [Bacillota bacterium]|nr:hypothetical protein [Bacillota bacterium]
MATILSSKKSTYGSPYAYYTVSVTASNRTPTSVKLTVKATGKLQYSSSFLGTGNGYGLTAGIYVGGSWHTWTLKKESTSWSGTSSHSASTSFTVSVSPGTSSLSAKFRCYRTSGAGNAAQLNSTSCSSISIANVTSTYSSVALTAGTSTQKQVAVTLSGVPKSVGFATTIKWYQGSTHVGSTSVASSATATSYAYTFTGLLPNTNYTLKAITYYSSTALSTKTVAVQTPQEEGTLTLTPKATYITAGVSGMFNGPNYTRSIEYYIKRSEASTYTLVSTVSSQTATASANLTGLISNADYDVQVLIKNGTTTLKTLTASVSTTEDTSLIPTANIESITQQLGTRLCTITWITDKSVAGTTYVIEAKADGEDAWTTLSTLDEVSSPVVVTAHDGNVDTAFRISSANESVAEGFVNYSDEYAFYVRDDFLWDSEKTAGEPFVLTANEWNRLREYAVARNEDLGNVVDIPMVNTGDLITATTYNVMKNAISNVTPITIADKRRGDAITAADVDALRIAINTA